MSGVPFPVGLCTLLANHHGISQPSATVLWACFLLMAPFRTRFSPCEKARTANVQRLKGCLYTLWYCYIPICRCARHSLFPLSACLVLPLDTRQRGSIKIAKEMLPEPLFPTSQNPPLNETRKLHTFIF